MQLSLPHKACFKRTVLIEVGRLTLDNVTSCVVPGSEVLCRIVSVG